MIHEAITYRITYGLSVFPVQPGGKRPLFSWERFQTQPANYQEITSWRAHCNLAMATGALSGVVIVDCESAEDTEWFTVQRSGSPLRTQTPRGYHLWFRHPGGHVPCAAKVPDPTGRPRYDIRGDGGYVLLPPSNVVADGKDVKVSGEYRFDRCGLSALASLPPFRMQWHRQEQRDDRPVRHGKAYIKHIRAISGQRGHDETYRAVCRLLDAEMSESEALLCMQAWNQTNAVPPWSDRDLLHKIRSVYGRKHA